MHITRLSVRRSRPSTRRSGHTYAQPSTAAASKTEIVSSESIKGRASAIVEYGNRPERIKEHRAQGHYPPPDARTRARTFNAPAAFPPNTLVTGGVITDTHPVVLFAALPTKWPRACQDAGNRDGTSNRCSLEATKVSAPGNRALHGVRPSTTHGSFLKTSWASTDNTTTTPPDLPPCHTSVRPLNQPKTVRRAGCRGTRNHYQATKMGRLEATPVRKPQVGQRSMLLSTPTLTPIHVPWVSPWCYKRKDSGIDRQQHVMQHHAHT